MDAANGSDPLGGALAAVASLRQAAQQLVAERSQRSPDGSVEVTVAAGRVVGITLDVSLVRAAHGVDRATLQQQVLQAARVALGLTPLPQPVPGDAEDRPVAGLSAQQVAEFAARTFLGEDADRTVSATVAGTGELVDVSITETAVHGDALDSVGARLVSVLARAQSAFEAARRDTFGLGDIEADLDAKVDAFDKRIDGLLGQMSSVNTALASRMTEIQELYNKRVR